MSGFRGWGWRGPGPPVNVPFGLNTQSPQAQGLVAWFPTVDVVVQRAVRDRIGGLTLGAIWNVGVVPAPDVGRAIRFDGVDDGLLWTGGLTEYSGNVNSLALWARVVAPDGSTSRVLSYHNPQLLEWYFTSTQRVSVAGGSEIALSATVFDSQWHHWVLVSSGTATAAYRDGVLAGTGGAGMSVSAGVKTWKFGRYVGGGEGYTGDYNGDMADIRFYNRALTPAVIWQMANPPTMWDLYRPLTQRLWAFPATAGARWPIVGPGIVGGGIVVGRAA